MIWVSCIFVEEFPLADYLSTRRECNACHRRVQYLNAEIIEPVLMFNGTTESNQSVNIHEFAKGVKAIKCIEVKSICWMRGRKYGKSKPDDHRRNSRS